METQQYRIVTGNKGWAADRQPLQGKDWVATVELDTTAADTHVVVVTPDGESVSLQIAMNTIMMIKTRIEMDMLSRRKGAQPAPVQPAPQPPAPVTPTSTAQPPVTAPQTAVREPETITWIQPGVIGHYPGGNIREVFNKLDELAESIRQHGIMQPLTVNDRDGHYMLVAGERRLRAAGLVGLPEVPCWVRHLTDAEALELMAIENLQREDLNPIEEARSYQRLLQVHGTRERVAERIGKSRVYVTEYLQLLDLPADMQHQVATGTISVRTGLEFLRRTKDVPDDAKQKVAETVTKTAPTARQAGEVIDKALQDAGVARTTSQRQEKPADSTGQSAPATVTNTGQASAPGTQLNLFPEPNQSGIDHAEITYCFEMVIHAKGKDFKATLFDLVKQAESAGIVIGSFGDAWAQGTDEEHKAEEIRKLIGR